RCRPMCTTPPGRLCFYRRRRKRASLGRRCLGSCVTASRFRDRKSTRLNSSHVEISYAVFCLKKKKKCVGTLTKCSYNDHLQLWRARLSTAHVAYSVLHASLLSPSLHEPAPSLRTLRHRQPNC